MKKITSSLILLFAVLFTLSMSAQAQAKKKVVTVSVKGKAVEKSRGANSNIKMDMPTTDKPVAKSRGADCSVMFDNYTGLFIKIYVDGSYRGTLDAFGKGSVTVNSGYTTIYCISAGGTREWSADGNCDGTYSYKLQ